MRRRHGTLETIFVPIAQIFFHWHSETMSPRAPSPTVTRLTQLFFLQKPVWGISFNGKSGDSKRWRLCKKPTATILEGPTKEVHLCTDRPWKSIKETIMSAIPSVDTMQDDEQFFHETRKVLVRCQGGRWQRWLSLKSYKHISLSKVIGLIHSFGCLLIKL